ncbi:hypothetical protein [Pseudoalteromonas luteoviolacea]|uniref:Uncharacterized protein n=1 Tax=Pseudoalteromonas luteoviolacea S4054 TaxID=1129367 RepID=A0A0F6A883_9GAMM|nr:hypothetical protein [Pseudoalteromonas luteoviolacea]AOT10699.1 hypothetical protein S4054249_22855 [Pseudoalteromonas luteoviolacea]AOT16139.1 hypothetical protein S40542_25655 [Pseudoalteromonas luteoviolacea]AOT20519.1 hypothetical protein S4054_22770 [Pseudoalteromonas luteoviolacea]KKE82071.1 hypothetical protein N479_20180 [Pseudoalteromonas luteoviolacea S4054]KZN67710.1 hypothetical protein N481_23735 [Pseudoalteromonas luteoviolacea S4047-1]
MKHLWLFVSIFFLHISFESFGNVAFQQTCPTKLNSYLPSKLKAQYKKHFKDILDDARVNQKPMTWSNLSACRPNNKKLKRYVNDELNDFLSKNYKSLDETSLFNYLGFLNNRMISKRSLLSDEKKNDIFAAYIKVNPNSELEIIHIIMNDFGYRKSYLPAFLTAIKPEITAKNKKSILEVLYESIEILYEFHDAIVSFSSEATNNVASRAAIELYGNLFFTEQNFDCKLQSLWGHYYSETDYYSKLDRWFNPLNLKDINKIRWIITDRDCHFYADHIALFSSKYFTSFQLLNPTSTKLDSLTASLRIINSVPESENFNRRNEISSLAKEIVKISFGFNIFTQVENDNRRDYLRELTKFSSLLERQQLTKAVSKGVNEKITKEYKERVINSSASKRRFQAFVNIWLVYDAWVKGKHTLSDPTSLSEHVKKLFNGINDNEQAELFSYISEPLFNAYMYSGMHVQATLFYKDSFIPFLENKELLNELHRLSNNSFPFLRWIEKQNFDQGNDDERIRATFNKLNELTAKDSSAIHKDFLNILFTGYIHNMKSCVWELDPNTFIQQNWFTQRYPNIWFEMIVRDRESEKCKKKHEHTAKILEFAFNKLLIKRSENDIDASNRLISPHSIVNWINASLTAYEIRSSGIKSQYLRNNEGEFFPLLFISSPSINVKKDSDAVTLRVKLFREMVQYLSSTDANELVLNSIMEFALGIPKELYIKIEGVESFKSRLDRELQNQPTIDLHRNLLILKLYDDSFLDYWEAIKNDASIYDRRKANLAYVFQLHPNSEDYIDDRLKLMRHKIDVLSEFDIAAITNLYDDINKSSEKATFLDRFYENYTDMAFVRYDNIIKMGAKSIYGERFLCTMAWFDSKQSTFTNIKKQDEFYVKETINAFLDLNLQTMKSSLAESDKSDEDYCRLDATVMSLSSGMHYKQKRVFEQNSKVKNILDNTVESSMQIPIDKLEELREKSKRNDISSDTCSDAVLFSGVAYCNLLEFSSRDKVSDKTSVFNKVRWLKSSDELNKQLEFAFVLAETPKQILQNIITLAHLTTAEQSIFKGGYLFDIKKSETDTNASYLISKDVYKLILEKYLETSRTSEQKKKSIKEILDVWASSRTIDEKIQDFHIGAVQEMINYSFPKIVMGLLKEQEELDVASSSCDTCLWKPAYDLSSSEGTHNFAKPTEFLDLVQWWSNFSQNRLYQNTNQILGLGQFIQGPNSRKEAQIDLENESL